MVQIEDNILTVITDAAEWPEDIDRIRASARRAEIISQLEKADHSEMEGLKKELRAAEVLVAVSSFTPRG